MWKSLGVVGLLVYVCYSFTNLYQVTSPPLANPGDLQDILQPILKNGKPYTLEVYISEKPNTFEKGTYVGTFNTSVGHEHDCLTTKVTGAAYHASRYGLKSCIFSLDYRINQLGWITNDTKLYISTIMRVDKLRAPSVRPINELYVPEQKDTVKKRFLLTNIPFPPKYEDKTPFAAIPPKIRVGRVDITENIGKKALLERNLGSWMAIKNKYLTHVEIDHLISPRDEYIPLTNDQPKITIELFPVTWRKWYLQNLFLHAIESMETTLGTDRYDSDSLKLLLAGNHMYVLVLTFSVSILHLIFEFLALSSNLTHFNATATDSNASQRVSRKAILLDFYFELVVLLWLRDEGHARIVQLVIGAKLLFNLWRYWKLLRIQTAVSKPESKGIAERSSTEVTALCCVKRQELEKLRSSLNVEEFEKQCLKSLLWLSAPFLIALGIYQLIMVPHKGWYSWAIKTAALSSYIGGFVAMTPQLYKNYYFQAVDHLPWSALTYQFLNTIIDDLFSFLIRMPAAHRLSVFRDDIIFVVYWFQKRHYKNQQKTEKKKHAD